MNVDDLWATATEEIENKKEPATDHNFIFYSRIK